MLFVSITLSIAASAIPPCLIALIKVLSKFEVFEEKSYHEIIWLQILKTLREEKNAVRELRRCDERVHMLQCLVMQIKFTMFMPGLVIFYLVTILRLSYVCGVQLLRVWRKIRFLEHSNRQVAARWCLGAGAPSLVSFYITI